MTLPTSEERVHMAQQMGEVAFGKHQIPTWAMTGDILVVLARQVAQATKAKKDDEAEVIKRITEWFCGLRYAYDAAELVSAIQDRGLEGMRGLSVEIAAMFNLDPSAVDKIDDLLRKRFLTVHAPDAGTA